MWPETSAAKEVQYGPAPMPVELRCGVLLAARAGVLQQDGVRFDPRFGFHFYDLDLCRTARQQGRWHCFGTGGGGSGEQRDDQPGAPPLGPLAGDQHSQR